MHIGDRIVEVKDKIAEIRRSYEGRLKDREESGLSPQEYAKLLGQEMRAEVDAAGLSRELDTLTAELKALKQPIVSMVEHSGRLLIATAGGVFELKGDKLVWIRFDEAAQVQH